MILSLPGEAKKCVKLWGNTGGTVTPQLREPYVEPSDLHCKSCRGAGTRCGSCKPETSTRREPHHREGTHEDTLPAVHAALTSKSPEIWVSLPSAGATCSLGWSHCCQPGYLRPMLNRTAPRQRHSANRKQHAC